MNLEFRMHKNARTALIITGVLLCILCFTIPVAIWMFWRVSRAKVAVTSDGVVAEGLLTNTVKFDDIERFGVLRVPLVARGIGAILANMKLDNMGEGVNAVFKLKDGKEVKVLTNQFERHQELMAELSKRVRVPTETLTMGLVSLKWPERA